MVRDRFGLRAGTARRLLLAGALGLGVAGAAAETGRYLVVSASAFAGTDAVQDLVDAREARGFDVTVYEVPVGALKEGIRAHVQGWYVAGVPGYVLVIGDSDGTTVPATATTVPHWSGGGAHGSPTDLPYACMDGAADWYPEVALGRFAVDTVAELTALVGKTLLAEAGVFGDPTYVKRAAFIATNDTSAGAEATHDWVINTYMQPAGFASTRIYANQGGSPAQISAAVNGGSLFTTYFGHSGFSGWWNPAFYSADVQALTNDGLYGLVLGMSCGSARFDWSYGECFGEYWTREANRGAAAFISATTIMPTDWECTRRIEKHFYQTIFADGIWEVGPAWRGAMDRLYNDPSYGPSHPDTRDYFEMFVLIGDPALRLPHESTGDGDYDGDGDVDVVDFAAFQRCFGESALGPACAAGNLAGGFAVDGTDFGLYAAVLRGPGE